MWYMVGAYPRSNIAIPDGQVVGRGVHGQLYDEGDQVQHSGDTGVEQLLQHITQQSQGAAASLPPPMDCFGRGTGQSKQIKEGNVTIISKWGASCFHVLETTNCRGTGLLLNGSVVPVTLM
jgi:hypothetical protein